MPHMSTRQLEDLLRRSPGASARRVLEVQRHHAAPSPPKVQKPREMNGLERSYQERLFLQVAVGEIAWAGSHESIRLELAHGSWFTPDFPVVAMDGVLEFHETKGFWREAARVRIKVAARMFPKFRFVGVQRINGVWQFERFDP